MDFETTKHVLTPKNAVNILQWFTAVSTYPNLKVSTSFGEPLSVLQSLSKCTLERFESPDVSIKVLPLPHLFKATGFSYLFNAQFDKLCKNQSIFGVAQHLPILYQHFSSRLHVRFGLGLFQLIPHYILAFQTCEPGGTSISGNGNEKEAGDWGDKRRERDSLLSLTPFLFFFFVFFSFLFFALHPSLLTPGTDKIRGGRRGRGREAPI